MPSVLAKDLKMAENTEEGRRTHTSDAFVDFAYDLLEYAMPKYGFVWVKPQGYQRRSKKLFREIFGDAVILFRSRHPDHYTQRFALVSEMEFAEDILYHIDEFHKTIFKGNMPLMEIIAYYAFLLDMATICLELEDPFIIYNIVDDTADVFYKYIKPYFTVVGGWFSLYRVTVQYLRYITQSGVSDEDDKRILEEFGAK